MCIRDRLNSNVAVYGASGSKKTRAYCVNRILQAASKPKGESLIICDPKSELYEKTSAYLRSKGYVVKVFNLVTPSCSCLLYTSNRRHRNKLCRLASHELFSLGRCV